MDLKMLQAGAIEDISAVNSINFNVEGENNDDLNESFSGLNNIIAIAQKTQNRLTMKKQKQNLDRINNTKISRDHSINYAEDEPDKQDYEEVDEDNMMN